MAKDLHPVAQRLLDEHIAFELKGLTGKRLQQSLRTEVNALFSLCQNTRLDTVVTVDQIMGVIDRKVIAMEMGPGIPELAGESAAAVLEAHQHYNLGDILDRERFAEFVDQALVLRHQREKLISEVLSHPLYSDLVASLVYQGIVNYLYEDNLISKSVPGVSSIMKFGSKWANKAVPGLDGTVEKRLKRYITGILPTLIKRSEQFLNEALTDAEIKDSLLAIWNELESHELADLQDNLGDWELHEFVVLGYEFWLNFRQTPYFRDCCQVVVSYFMDKYGKQPIGRLLDDLGVTEPMVMEELEAFAPPLMRTLKKEGYLEAMLRRRLSPFYQSAAVTDILDSEQDQ